MKMKKLRQVHFQLDKDKLGTGFVIVNLAAPRGLPQQQSKERLAWLRFCGRPLDIKLSLYKVQKWHVTMATWLGTLLWVPC